MNWQALGIAFFTLFIVVSIVLGILWLLQDVLFNEVERQRKYQARKRGEIEPIISKKRR